MSEIRKVRNEDGLIIFNALFPQIRNRIVNQTNPNLLTPEFVSDIIREFIIRAEDTNPLTRVEGDIVSNAFDDLEVEYNVDIISDLVEYHYILTYARNSLSSPIKISYPL